MLGIFNFSVQLIGTYKHIIVSITFKPSNPITIFSTLAFTGTIWVFGSDGFAGNWAVVVFVSDRIGFFFTKKNLPKTFVKRIRWIFIKQCLLPRHIFCFFDKSEKLIAVCSQLLGLQQFGRQIHWLQWSLEQQLWFWKERDSFFTGGLSVGSGFWRVLGLSCKTGGFVELLGSLELAIFIRFAGIAGGDWFFLESPAELTFNLSDLWFSLCIWYRFGRTHSMVKTGSWKYVLLWHEIEGLSRWQCPSVAATPLKNAEASSKLLWQHSWLIRYSQIV